MKKFAFILMALISGSAFAQETATAETFAEIVEPLKISKDTDLNFGRIIGGSAGGGTVSIDATAAGDRTVPAALDAPGGTTGSAKFTITASDYNYEISLTPTDLVDQGSVGDDIPLTPKTNFESSSNIVSGDQTLYVGGDLDIAVDQAPGNYKGTVKVTVSYE